MAKAYILSSGIDGQCIVNAWWSKEPTKEQVEKTLEEKLSDRQWKELCEDGLVIINLFTVVVLEQLEESK